MFLHEKRVLKGIQSETPPIHNLPPPGKLPPVFPFAIPPLRGKNELVFLFYRCYNS